MNAGGSFIANLFAKVFSLSFNEEQPAESNPCMFLNKVLFTYLNLLLKQF